MTRRIRRFLRCDCGAVTVDWVMLCAVMVAMGIFAMTEIGGGAQTLVTATDSAMADTPTY